MPFLTGIVKPFRDSHAFLPIINRGNPDYGKDSTILVYFMDSHKIIPFLIFSIDSRNKVK